MAATVLISHFSKVRRTATALCTALEARGVACWIASRDIGAGENFQEAIVRTIRSAPGMVLVFSGNANNSAEITKELALASERRIPVFPVRAEDVAPTGAFAYELSTRQWIDLFEDWERGIERLAEQVRRVCLADEAVPAPAPVPPPQRRRRVSPTL